MKTYSYCFVAALLFSFVLAAPAAATEVSVSETNDSNLYENPYYHPDMAGGIAAYHNSANNYGCMICDDFIAPNYYSVINTVTVWGCGENPLFNRLNVLVIPDNNGKPGVATKTISGSCSLSYTNHYYGKDKIMKIVIDISSNPIILSPREKIWIGLQRFDGSNGEFSVMCGTKGKYEYAHRTAKTGWNWIRLNRYHMFMNVSGNRATSLDYNSWAGVKTSF